MIRTLSSAFETAKYWAGQKLLHSPYHPYYLQAIGHRPKPQNYAEWLLAERLALGGSLVGGETPPGYRMVLAEGAKLAPAAIHRFVAAVEGTSADLVYSDEDVLGKDGIRRSPVFKPGWSPELYRHCDYLGGSYLIRDGIDVNSLDNCIVTHIPQVLVHRAEPAHYHFSDNGYVQHSGKVAAIICSRSVELAAACLQAIRSITTRIEYEIILIDHRAGLGTLGERFQARVLPYNEDFNFARMCNLGAGKSTGELLLFLNDDTVPLHQDWMERMAAQAIRPEIGAVGALLTYPDGRIQHAGVYVGTSNGAGHPGRLGRGTPMWPWLTMTREQLAVTGACLMMRRQVFESLDGFDETFPVNYNDVDLCLRCGATGYKVILEANSRVEHRESATRKTGIRYGERRRFLTRWAATLERQDPYWNPNLTDNELLLPDPDAFSRVRPWR